MASNRQAGVGAMIGLSINYRKAILRILVSGMTMGIACFAVIAADDQRLSLSQAVLWGRPSVWELKQSQTLKTNACVRKYLDVVSAGSCLLSADSVFSSENVLKDRRRHLKQQIVILMGDHTEKEAEAFILAVPLILEWEGRSENPKSEADFVESWLQKRPETSIAPFLYLLKAHRLRAAFEAARARNEKKLWPVLATKYKEAVVKAKSFDHPLMTCIVDDMEAQDYVYLEGYGKP